jgi:MaoC like domain/short chain dehydrogenase
MTQILASRSFRLADQQDFARLSADFNPMHLDEHFARRAQVGAPVVHGIHNLIWAANAALALVPFKVANVRARFPQPLYLDEVASVRLKTSADDWIELEVIAADVVIATIKLSSKPAKIDVNVRRLAPAVPAQLREPADPAFDTLAGQSGVATVADFDAHLLYPTLAGAIGSAGINALLATSQIVGMRCPGLHSLFAGLSMNFGPGDAKENNLAYAVSKVDARFRSLQIEVSGYGATGRLEAFARPAPPVQARLAEIAARMDGRPFAGQAALVVGGSRGLGEVTAKIIAAGGGHPVITYRDSRPEAERVVAEIRKSGGQCDSLQYDALRPAAAQLQQIPKIDCLYYFATPKIFQRKSALFEPDKLRTFLAFYADGFSDLCAMLARGRPDKLVAFYPSSIAIDEPVNGTAEYAMAKAAGEILAGHISSFMPNIEIVSRRLPRILTDQTATVGVASAAGALDVMLPIIYQVQRIAAQSLKSGD